MLILNMGDGFLDINRMRFEGKILTGDIEDFYEFSGDMYNYGAEKGDDLTDNHYTWLLEEDQFEEDIFFQAKRFENDPDVIMVTYRQKTWCGEIIEKRYIDEFYYFPDFDYNDENDPEHLNMPEELKEILP